MSMNKKTNEMGRKEKNILENTGQDRVAYKLSTGSSLKAMAGRDQKELAEWEMGRGLQHRLFSLLSSFFPFSLCSILD